MRQIYHIKIFMEFAVWLSIFIFCLKCLMTIIIKNLKIELGNYETIFHTKVKTNLKKSHQFLPYSNHIMRKSDFKEWLNVIQKSSKLKGYKSIKAGLKYGLHRCFHSFLKISRNSMISRFRDFYEDFEKSQIKVQNRSVLLCPNGNLGDLVV